MRTLTGRRMVSASSLPSVAAIAAQMQREEGMFTSLPQMVDLSRSVSSSLAEARGEVHDIGYWMGSGWEQSASADVQPMSTQSMTTEMAMDWAKHEMYEDEFHEWIQAGGDEDRQAA